MRHGIRAVGYYNLVFAGLTYSTTNRLSIRVGHLQTVFLHQRYNLIVQIKAEARKHLGNIRGAYFVATLSVEINLVYSAANAKNLYQAHLFIDLLFVCLINDREPCSQRSTTSYIHV